jgi:hypothetical protein
LIITEKNGYLFIDEDNYETKDIKLFGDTQRAFSVFKKNELIVENSNKYYVPSDINKFIFEYEYSKYVSCKNTLLKSEINTEISDLLRHVTDTITSFNKIYWLDGTTLLGLLFSDLIFFIKS